MGGQPRRRHLARPAALAAALALLLCLPTSAAAGWGPPFRLAQPFSLDVLPPQLAFSASGSAAVTFGVQDVDAPANSAGYAVWRAAGGRVSQPQPVPNSQQVLAVAFEGASAALLLGDSPAGLPCCSSAAVAPMRADGSFGAPTTLLSGLTGTTAGELVSFSGRLLAAVATERGVWVAQSSSSGRFGQVHSLTSGDARPEELAAAPLTGGGAIVAWTERDRRSSAPRRVLAATGTVHSAPAGARTVVSVPPGHRIDELALSDGGATVAWVDSWYDRAGTYHSQVELADRARPRLLTSLPFPGTVASGLAFAADPAGDQLLAWKTCSREGSCSVREVLRRAAQRFTGPLRLGAIDPGEAPRAALARTRAGLVAWIDGGHVDAAAVRGGATRFGLTQTVSHTSYAADLALAFGPSGTALAAWSQGTLAPDVIGDAYHTG